jgi:hypothetical protein
VLNPLPMLALNPFPKFTGAGDIYLFGLNPPKPPERAAKSAIEVI